MRLVIKFRKTKLTMQILFESVDERNEIVEVFNVVVGLNQTLSKLEEYLTIFNNYYKGSKEIICLLNQ